MQIQKERVNHNRWVLLFGLGLCLALCTGCRQQPSPTPSSAHPKSISRPLSRSSKHPRAGKAPTPPRGTDHLTRPHISQRRAKPRRYRPNLWQVGAAKEYRHIEIYEVKARQTYAFACTVLQGFQVYDISDPNAPKEHGEFRFPLPYGGYNKPGCRHLSLDGALAFASNSNNAFQPLSFVVALDITDPAKPRALRYFADKRFNLGGLAADHRRVYVAAHKQGLLVLDLVHQTQPASGITTRPTTRRIDRPVARLINQAMDRPTSRPMARSLTRPITRPVDRSTARFAPQNPMAALQRTIQHTGRLAHGTNRAESQHHELRLVAQLKAFRNVQAVTRRGRMLYIADGAGGLKIAKLSPVHSRNLPGHKPLQLIGQASTAGFARRVAIHQGHAYVSQGHAGFAIFDINNPRHPRQVAQVPTTYSVIEIALAKQFAYVANWNDLRVYDISRPTHPRLIAVRALPKRKDTFRLPYEESLTQIRNTSLAVLPPHIILGEWVGLRVLRFAPTEVPIAAMEPASGVLTFVHTRPGQQYAIIRNIGQRPLAVTKIAIHLAGSGATQRQHFRTKERPFVLAPGQTKKLVVTYTPTQAQHHTNRATLKLDTNDPHRPTLALGLETVGKAGRGTKHRNFALFDLDGKRHTLSSLQGKVVFLSYFATF